MFLGNKGRGNGQAASCAVAGYDMDGRYAQISYCLPGNGQPETVSQTAGEEEFLIPAMLARCTDRDLWLYGKEARMSAEKGEATAVTDLLEKAVQKEEVFVGGQSFDPVALLSLFFKRTLSLLSPALAPGKIRAFAFTVEEVTGPVIDVLTQAFSMLGLKGTRLYVVGRAESFFYYNINQPAELWARDVLLCDFSGPFLKTLLFTLNRRTTPTAAFVEEASFPHVRRLEQTQNEDKDRHQREKLDRFFSDAAGQLLRDRNVSTVYLIGEGFEGEWYQESLKLLCQGRRVFLGNNLYSKGACYAAAQRLSGTGPGTEYAFLGKDMIKANVGMHVQRRGQDAYLALLDAGTNWYEAKKECEFLLEEENGFTLRITPLNGKEVREVVVTLKGLAKRPPRMTRIRMRMDMTDVETVRISMEDLGFGEFYPATHQFWEETFSLA